MRRLPYLNTYAKAYAAGPKVSLYRRNQLCETA